MTSSFNHFTKGTPFFLIVRRKKENKNHAFPDSPDYLWDQGDRGKSIKEKVGPVVGQHVPVLRKISLAMRVIFDSSEAKRSTSGLPKIPHISWTVCGWSVHSSEGTLLRDSMSAPRFGLPRGTHRSIHWCFFQGARAWFTMTRRHPWRQTCGGTRGFSQYWRGRMWSRPYWSTEDAEAMRPSIFWNTLRGRGTPSLNEATSCWMASARSGVTTALIRAELITVPRNEICWLGDSVLLAKLTLRPRHSKSR